MAASLLGLAAVFDAQVVTCLGVYFWNRLTVLCPCSNLSLVLLFMALVVRPCTIQGFLFTFACRLTPVGTLTTSNRQRGTEPAAAVHLTGPAGH